MSARKRIVALSGGVGGAKLALGLKKCESDLSIIANTGDDFEHLGLSVSPDIDTMTYTLAGIANPETGWGRADESWSFMESLAMLGGETWFRLGDKDLALNVLRTNLLKYGATLSEVTARVVENLGLSSEIIPMTDSTVRTIFQTDHGVLEFQDYFVRLQCQPVVTSIEFQGADNAKPSPRFAALLSDPDVGAFVICPSNPLISIDPILAIPSVRSMLSKHPSPVIAVSPLVGGQSIKGPTSKLMSELGLGASSREIANYYSDFIDGFVLDHRDSSLAEDIEKNGIRTLCSDIVMSTLEDRCRLAREILEFEAILHQ